MNSQICIRNLYKYLILELGIEMIIDYDRFMVKTKIKIIMLHTLVFWRI